MSAMPRPLWTNQVLLHVHSLGDGAWGVFTQLTGNGPRMLARCGGPDAEAHARFFAEAWNLCHDLGHEPAEVKAMVKQLAESLDWALIELKAALGAVWEKNNWERYGPVVEARAVLAEVKDAS